MRALVFLLLCKPLDLTQNHLFQKVYTDIMGRGAAAPATVVIGTVEILDIVIVLVEVVVQVVTTVRAYQQTTEYIPLDNFCRNIFSRFSNCRIFFFPS